MKSALAFCTVMVLVCFFAMGQTQVVKQPRQIQPQQPTPRQVCWREYQDLIRDCNQQFQDAQSRQACYDGARVMLRDCLDALRPNNGHPRAEAKIVMESRSMPAWTTAPDRQYPVNVANCSKAVAYVPDCDTGELRQLVSRFVEMPDIEGGQLIIDQNSLPDGCNQRDLNVIIAVYNSTGELQDAVTFVSTWNIPCDADGDGEFDFVTDLNFVAATYGHQEMSAWVIRTVDEGCN